MMYLVDANVLSEPTKQTADSRVVDWLTANETNLGVDPIIIGELRTGILALLRGSVASKVRIYRWTQSVP